MILASPHSVRSRSVRAFASTRWLTVVPDRAMCSMNRSVNSGGYTEATLTAVAPRWATASWNPRIVEVAAHRAVDSIVVSCRRWSFGLSMKLADVTASATASNRSAEPDRASASAAGRPSPATVSASSRSDMLPSADCVPAGHGSSTTCSVDEGVTRPRRSAKSRTSAFAVGKSRPKFGDAAFVISSP
ncbi:hypothetical protein CA982_23030 [Gordonia lacunae]|uniref:Uncharacterized protein n=1 Tax=Gordonia lacunae TaxID=417102 RepID=A0A243Q4A8_9ACTN|nr:hypothetical protein CA982_23030 [Gordonia lacunae]